MTCIRWMQIEQSSTESAEVLGLKHDVDSQRYAVAIIMELLHWYVHAAYVQI